MQLPDHAPKTQRYAVRERIGGGSTGVVFEAFDRRRKTLIALKALRAVSPTHIYRFKEEFRSLADIQHPNLVNLYELVAEHGEWFIAMELVRGVPFHVYVRGLAAPHDSASFSQTWLSDVEDLDVHPIKELPVIPINDPERLRVALIQLVQGVSALHQAGKLHRDLKPSNVLVDEHGRVVLVDFGLVYDVERALSEQTQLGKIVGTAAFLAPEVSAGKAPTQASDLYAVGVMLYQGLLGRLPYVGSVSHVLIAKQTEDPPSPSSLADDLPTDLAVLAMDLLSRDPARRPSAQACLQRLGGELNVQPRAQLADSSGRQAQRQELEDAWERAARGWLVVTTVRARSGMGKTTLLREFVRNLRKRGVATVLEGRCYERESVPYKAFDPIMDGIRRRLLRMDEATRDELLANDQAALAQLFPVLAQFVEGEDEPELDPASRRSRAFQASITLISRLAKRRPVVVVIDDVQWGDADSARLLAAWIRQLQRRPLLIVLAYRLEDEDGSEFVSAYRRDPYLHRVDHRIVELWELPSNATWAAAHALVLEHPDPDGAASWVARESGGAPYLIAELAREALHQAEEGSWNPQSFSLHDIVQGRLSRLPEPARHLLSMAALSGRPLPVRVLAEAAGLDESDVLDAVTLLRARHLVRTSQGPLGELLEIYDNRIARSLERGTLNAERARSHLDLARCMERHGWDEPESLMQHLLHGGQLDRAAEMALKAADHAADNLAFDKAVRLYRTAASLGDWEGAAALQLQIALGDALVHSGRGAEAAKVLLACAKTAPPEQTSALHRRATEQLLRAGHLDEAQPHVQEMLSEVGLSLPSEGQVWWLLLWQRFRLRWRGIRLIPTVDPPDARTTRFIDTCWAISQALSFVDPLRGAYFHTQGLRRALDSGDRYRAVRTLAMELPYLALSGAGADQLGRLQVQMREHAGHLTRQRYLALGIMGTGEGLSAYLDARFKTAYRQLRRAERTFEEQCPSASFELATARLYALRALIYTGELKQARASWPSLLQDAEDRGSRLLTANLRSDVFMLLRLADEDLQLAEADLAHTKRRWQRARYPYQHFSTVRGEALIALYKGDTHQAWATIHSAWPLLKSAGLTHNHFARTMALDLLGRCAAAQLPHDKQLLQPLKRAIRDLERESLRGAAGMAASLKAALVRAQGGDPTPHLQRALEDFQAHDYGLRAALVRRALGRALGGDEGAAHVAGAEGWIANQDIASAARFAAVLAPGLD